MVVRLIPNLVAVNCLFPFVALSKYLIICRSIFSNVSNLIVKCSGQIEEEGQA